MNLLSALNALLLLAAPVNTAEIELEPVDFRIQVYPYGGYYSNPPYCPPGYFYGPRYGYGPRCYPWGYRGYYYGPRFYYGPRYYYKGKWRRHHGRHHGRGGRGRGRGRR